MNTLVQTIGRIRVGQFGDGAINPRAVGGRRPGSGPGNRLPVRRLWRQAGASLRCRRGVRRRSLPRGVRFHIGLAGVPVRPGAAPGCGLRWSCSAWPRFCSCRRSPRGNLFGRQIIGAIAPLNVSLLDRRVPVRHRDATRQRLRLGDPVHRRRRKQPHVGHARGLHRRIGDRHAARSLVVRPARLLVDCPGPRLRASGGPDHPVHRVRARSMS